MTNSPPTVTPSYPTAEAAAQTVLLTEPDRSDATLAKGAPWHVIGLDQLSAYRPEHDPALLLQGGDIFFFPVRVGGEATWSIVVRKQSDGTWSFAESGLEALAKAFDSARCTILAMDSTPVPSSFALVSAMAHYFLSWNVGDTVFFKGLGGKKSPFHTTEAAREVLAKLQPEAAAKQQQKN